MTEAGIVQADFEIVKTGISALGKPEDMRLALDLNAERLQIVHQYIDDNFVRGIHYGPSYDGAKKDALLKPGAESICKLFNTTARWRMDRDTWEMFGKPRAVFYICEIVENSTGRVIGEGRGGGEYGEKKRDMNKVVKNAEKCSLVDAALYTFCLSSMYTQVSEFVTSQLKMEKKRLWDLICDARSNAESSMKNSEFLKKVTAEVIGMDPTTVGEIRELKRIIIDDGLYDLATGEALPDDL
jgi:hypothetical protein